MATLTATLATVSVGDITINGYEVEGLEGYRHSLTQIEACVSGYNDSVRRILHKLSMAQKVQTQRLKVNHSKGSSDGASNLSSLVSLVDTETASILIMELACEGNVKAKALVTAFMYETLTRRLDIAFGKHRNEVEYQALADAAYKSLRDKFRREYLPKFHNYLDRDWRTLQKLPTGVQCQSHWQARQVYALKKAVGLEYKTDVDDYSEAALVVYEQALLDYDCFRRTGLTHEQSLSALAKQENSRQRREQVLK